MIVCDTAYTGFSSQVVLSPQSIAQFLTKHRDHIISSTGLSQRHSFLHILRASILYHELLHLTTSDRTARITSIQYRNPNTL
jgi:hypothetical protein